MAKKQNTNWEKFYKLNNYYHKDLENFARHIIPKDSSVIEFSSKSGELLEGLQNKIKVGIETNLDLIKLGKERNKKTKLYDQKKYLKSLKGKKFDYVILSHALSEEQDIQFFIKNLTRISHEDTRIVVFYFNFIWKPILELAEKIGFKLPQTKEPNWLTEKDIENFFYLESFELIKSGKRFIFPYNIPYIANFINRYLSPLPIINSFCLTNYLVFKPKTKRRDYSVSIIIPARNEEGNMKKVLNKIPLLGKKTEVIFIEGHSKDKTYKVIKEEIRRYKGKIKARLFKQKGRGKGDAVRLGFSKAKNDLLIILDADLTVSPKELHKFYGAIAKRQGDLIMGSRLVYPMEKAAMRNLNYLGNRLFSWAFTFVLGQRIKDTLCGTKVILKNDYKKIEKNRHVFGNFDPFGDFDLIFGANKLNLKIIEIPIRYKERTYGTTNISRFSHGLLLLKMLIFAAKKIKFI